MTMSNETIFVAIGIACVVAVLLFIVFIIYCVKRQQDKEQMRLMRQRRAREERQRRHLMAVSLVRPPPYDPHRQNFIANDQSHVPLSPPPEYKETATPLPRNRSAHGLENAFYESSPFYGSLSETDGIQTVSRNVAPANTILAGNYLNYGSSVPVSSINSDNSNGRYVNRTTITTTISSYIHDTSQDTSLSGARSANNDLIGYGRCQTPNTFSRNSHHVTPTQVLDTSALFEEDSITGLVINRINRSERNLYDSRTPRDVIIQTSLENSATERQQETGYTQMNKTTSLHKNDSTSHRLSTHNNQTSSEPYLVGSDIVEVAYVQQPNSSHHTESNSIQSQYMKTEQHDESITGITELSLI